MRSEPYAANVIEVITITAAVVEECPAIREEAVADQAFQRK
jgi:hypothetical protein